MSVTYVFGHKKPDTDSVVSSITLSYLKNKLGDNTEPRVLGDINKETKFVLSYFGFNEPRFLNDVKVQMRNMKFNTEAMIYENMSISCMFDAIHKFDVTGLPLINDKKELTGYGNLKDLARFLIEGNINNLNTSYDNILYTLNGKEILRFDYEIEGIIVDAAYRSETFIDRINIDNKTILMVNDKYNVVKKAILSKVLMIIVIGGNSISSDLLDLAKKNKVNIIETHFNAYKTANSIKLSNYIKSIEINKNPIKLSLSDYRDDFIDIANKCNHTNYPIVNKKNECLGMIRLIDINDYEKKKVILVDHNQKDQTVDGIDEAEIIEVVDHHNLGTIGTSLPINFRIVPVGCTNTIIYKLYKENKVDIPKDIAGIMVSAILSDTLLLKSPTTTADDILACEELCKVANLDKDKYGLEMFKAGSSIKGMSVEEIFNQDFKTYKVSEDAHLGISQIMTLDIDEINKKKNDFIHLMNDLCSLSSFKVVILFVTDVIKNGSYIYYSDSSKELVSECYNINNLEQGIFIEGLVSRKKQMLPLILDSIERKN